MEQDDDMVVEQPPHLQEDSQQQPAVKKITLNDDENDFDSMNIRPEALFLRGVDDLSPRNIKLYLDHYIKPDYSFANKDKYESLNYKIEWINDSSLNVVFQDSTNALLALQRLSSVPTDQLPNTDERPAQDYINEQGEDKTVYLHIRQSFDYDKKIKNARVYSRYYLLNGEPDKNDRPTRDYYNKFKHGSKNKYREREYKSRRDEEPDLITGEVVVTDEVKEDLIPDHRSLQERIGVPRSRVRRNRDDEEDLFPQFVKNHSTRSRSRSRSPSRRMEDVMDIDDNNNTTKPLDQRIYVKGSLLGLDK